MSRLRVRFPLVLVLAAAMTVTVMNGAESAPGDTTIFTDNFESGNLSNWQVNTSVNGTAVVQSGIGHDGPQAAHITVPSANGSKANIQYNLSPTRYALSASGWFKALAGGCNSSAYYSNGNLPFFRFFDANGRRVVGLYRINGPACGDNTKLYVQHSGGFFRVNKNMKFATWYKLELRAAVQTPGSSLVEVYLNDVKVFSITTADNGLNPFASVVIHNEHPDQVGEMVVDDVKLGTFESGSAPTNPCAPGTALPTSSDPGSTVIAEGFEAFNFNNWNEIEQAGTGTATIQTTQKHLGNCAAKLHVEGDSTSKANLRKTLPSGTTDIWADGWFRVATEGASNSNVPFFRVFNGTTTRVIDIYRQNVSGTLFVRTPAGTGYTYTSLNTTLPMNEWHNIKIHGTATAGADLVEVWLDGTKKLTKTDAEFGVATFDLLRVGSEHFAQVMDLYADDIIAKAS
jgi:hypothetical protein